MHAWPAHYLLGLALFVLGLLLLGCGANVCWLRLRPRNRKKSVKDLLAEDQALRRKSGQTPSSADKR